jgi:hypothetical protein
MGVQLEDEESETFENNTQGYKILYKRSEFLIKISCFNFEKQKIKYCFSLCTFIWGKERKSKENCDCSKEG